LADRFDGSGRANDVSGGSEAWRSVGHLEHERFERLELPPAVVGEARHNVVHAVRFKRHEAVAGAPLRRKQRRASRAGGIAEIAANLLVRTPLPAHDSNRSVRARSARTGDLLYKEHLPRLERPFSLLVFGSDVVLLQ